MWNNIQFNFEGKNYVVMGASSGMGCQVTLDLAESGANVLAIARNEERLKKLKMSFPQKITIATLDVLFAGSDEWDCTLSHFVQHCGKCHGGVYTAGVGGITSLRGYDEDDAKKILNTSYDGMISFLQQFIKKKYVYPSSSFVVFSSVAAYSGLKGAIAYSAAKAAVRASVKSIAKEICRDQHRINSISPGWVETNMTRNSVIMANDGMNSYASMSSMHRLGTGIPKDVSGAVLFLLSDAAKWITGTDVVVDGGFLLGSD